MAALRWILVLLWASLASSADCPDYGSHAGSVHEPLSTGRYQLSYQRPPPECRTFTAPEVEEVIDDMKKRIKDADLARLFENTFPNTLDTTILWKGVGQADPNEELTFIVTGDINAMWLRDSANQLQSYKPILRANSSLNSLASLFRGAINLQGRYIRESPYCNSFQPPPESGLQPQSNSWSAGDSVSPAYSTRVVFECKYELDSLAAFLQLSWDYYDATKDVDFFKKFKWSDTVRTIIAATTALQAGTYAADGNVNDSPFQFQRQANSASETVSNKGIGEPVRGDTGLIRSFFRPSDDSCIFQYLIPANMMFSRFLAGCAEIMEKVDGNLAKDMKGMADRVRAGIEKYGRASHELFGEVYAYEVDGFGSHNLMDDANLPSLLSVPMMGYSAQGDKIYQNTRKFVLSKENRYYMRGRVLSATGGPHIGPGMAWPMGRIVQAHTTDDDAEIVNSISELLSSTDQLGLMHESVNNNNARYWTRQWFSWANGLFGQMLLDLRDRKPHLLERSYQDEALRPGIKTSRFWYRSRSRYS